MQRLTEQYLAHANMPNIFNPAFKDFLKILSKNKVDYILVGGYAVILHGYIRSTGGYGFMGRKKQF